MSRSTDWTPSLWLDIFDELLYNDNELDYGDQWTLNFSYNQTDKVNKDERKRGWKVYCHCAFGKSCEFDSRQVIECTETASPCGKKWYYTVCFQCESCKKTWPSARVIVLFRYRLRGDRGTVIMRPFGQSCRRCQDDEFDLPGFSQKEVERALLRLFSKIRKNCYDDEDEDDDDGSSACSTKVWTKPHEASLCEACIMGICCQDDD